MKEKRKNELWLIDEKRAELYRVISEDKEQAIPIEGNPLMQKFLCIEKDEFKQLIENWDKE